MCGRTEGRFLSNQTFILVTYLHLMSYCLLASQELLFPEWITMRGPNRNSCIGESGCMLNGHNELMKRRSEGRNGSKIVLVHILKTGEKGGVVPLVPSFGSRWRWGVCFMLRPPYHHRQAHTLFSTQKARRMPELTCVLRDEIPYPIREWDHDP